MTLFSFLTKENSLDAISILYAKNKGYNCYHLQKKTLFNLIHQCKLVNFLNPKDANNTPIII